MMKMNTKSEVKSSISDNLTVYTNKELLDYLEKRGSDEYLNIAVTGDVHLEHRRVPTERILQTIDREFNDSFLSNLDVLVINGDLFDRKRYFQGDGVDSILIWMINLLKRCAKFGVALRVLEGTPSHDNKQPKRFMLLNEHLGDKKADVKYYEAITIDNLIDTKKSRELFGRLPVLYIPDEMNHDSSVTWRQVKESLRLEGIEQVIFSFIHGMFTYQEPIRTQTSHVEENYESITESAIVVNHWHLPSKSGKITAPGSMERLRHNEEETKGFYFASLKKDRTLDEFFIINPTATVFEKIDCRELNFNQVVEELDKRSGYEENSYFRLICNRYDEIYYGLPTLIKRYPLFNIDAQSESNNELDTINEATLLTSEITAIRPDTIYGLIQERITHDDPKVLEMALQIVKADKNVD